MSTPTSRTGNGGSLLSGGKNYNNVTLWKYNCLYIKLSTRIGNGGSPLSDGKTIAMLRSGNITVYISNCLHELGTAARRHAVQLQVACEKSRSAL